MLETKFLISEIAKIHHISAKTLRYYDSINLFKPKIINSETKYRYYTLDQFAQLDLIIYLKNLGLKLKEIKLQIESSTQNTYLDSFTTRLNNIEEEINRLITAKNTLKENIASIANYNNVDINKLPPEPILKELPEILLSITHIKEPLSDFNFVMAVKGSFFKHDQSLLIAGKPPRIGEVINIKLLNQEKPIVSTRLIMEVYDEQLAEEKFDQGKYISIVHKGYLKTLKISVNKMLKFAKMRGFKHDGEIYNIFLVDPIIAKNEDEFIAELFLRVW